METEWLLSRKIAFRSMSRHFAGWKLRQFVLNTATGILEVRTPDNMKTTIIDLKMRTVSMGRHDYASRDDHWLWLRYFDVEENCPKEIVMKFNDIDIFNRWERVRTFHIDYPH